MEHLRGCIKSDGNATVNRHDEASNGCNEQPVCVEAEPRKVEGNLFAEIVADFVQRLIREHLTRASPVGPENLPRI